MQPIKIKLDLSKVDTSRVFNGRNGAKYLDFVAFPTTESRFGDTHRVTQSLTADERKAGKKLPICGNLTVPGMEPKAESQRAPADSAQEDVAY